MEKEFWINKTQEELAEVIQALCKWRNYGPSQIHPDTGQSNREHLEEEIGDLLYCVDQLREELALSNEQIDYGYLSKERKISKYIGYSLLTNQDRDIKLANRAQWVNDDDDVDMDGRC